MRVSTEVELKYEFIAVVEQLQYGLGVPFNDGQRMFFFVLKYTPDKVARDIIKKDCK